MLRPCSRGKTSQIRQKMAKTPIMVFGVKRLEENEKENGEVLGIREF